jgi:hypothetical protein
LAALALLSLNVSAGLYLHIRWGDLLFVEGAVIFAASAYIALGTANLKRESYASLAASPEGHREYLEEQRSKQSSEGIIIMVVGVAIIAVSIIGSCM